LPNKESNFDRYRAVTPFKHLLDDYEKDIQEDDMTHLEEIVALHEHQQGATPESIRRENIDNFRTRSMHHHVFDIPLIRTMLQHCGFRVIHTCVTEYTFFALGAKIADPGHGMA
jgi:hypothetical protein